MCSLLDFIVRAVFRFRWLPSSSVFVPSTAYVLLKYINAFWGGGEEKSDISLIHHFRFCFTQGCSSTEDYCSLQQHYFD